MIFLWLLIIFNAFILYSSWQAIRKLTYARQVLQDIDNLHSAGIISTIQANVFLNDMNNPFDIGSIREVKRELDRIVQKELYVQQKNTN